MSADEDAIALPLLPGDGAQPPPDPLVKFAQRDTRFTADLHVSKATIAVASLACNSEFEAMAAEFSKRLGEVADKSSDFDEPRQSK
jgi:hypothetical protein